MISYINQYITDPDIQQIVYGSVILIFCTFGLQLFGWCFGRR